MNKYYTLIGSRSTPEDILTLMQKVAAKLNSEGWIVRSGGADGADSCAEQQDIYLNWAMQIYLPWEGFNGRSSNNRGYINSTKCSTYNDAVKIAEATHPNWKACSKGARALHTRNVYQVLGHSLDTPSKFVICWAEPTSDMVNVKGGTGTAVRLALQHNIPVINLWYEKDRERILNYLEG